MTKKYKIYILIMTAIVVILNAVAWLSKGFCDFYIDHIFKIWTNVLGRITGIFPFSVGEIMLIIAILGVFATIGIAVALIILRKKKGYVSFAKKYFKILLVVVLNICLIMTLNCTLLYHCTRIDPNPNYEKREYTVDEVEALYVYIVEQINNYAEGFERDERGYMIYDDDIMDEARKAMHNISDDYPRLSGYYPKVKKLLNSTLMCQARMAGYYFPFSMEANVNSMMHVANNPATYCHEMAHLHGYIYEDEANFIGYMACINSDDPFFVYSGYLSVYSYVKEAYIDSLGGFTAEEIKLIFSKLPKPKYPDYVFLLPEVRKKVQSHSIVNPNVIDDWSDKFTDASLKLNGIRDGIASYDGVVELLLEYYEGVLY